MNDFSRRDLLKAGVAGAATLALAGCATDGKGASKAIKPAAAAADGKAFQFVHLTDMHVRRKRRGDEGYRACVAHVNALNPRPDFALMGGDLGFDGLYTAKEEYIDQVGLYKSISDTLAMPYYNCMGNHDPLGWSARRKVALDDPDIGYGYIKKALNLENTYYSYDHKDWHFVVLDTMFPVTTDGGPSYEARIGEEQLHWLALDLGKAGDRPKVAVMHIAAFCNVGQISGDPKALAMNPGMVVKDNKDLREILERHKVKAMLQGHSHRTEDFAWRGVNYLTSPAVSGAWWAGDWTGDPPGYTLFTCADDKIAWERLFFPWKYQLEPEDTLETKKNEEWDAFLAKQKKMAEMERAGKTLV